MKILSLNIIIIALLLIPVVYGIAMVISGFRIYEGKAPILGFRASIWDKFLTQYDLYKWLYRNKQGCKEMNKYEMSQEYILHGLFVIILPLVFFLFLFFRGFVL